MSSVLPTKNVHFCADSVQPSTLSVHFRATKRAVRANRADSVQKIPVPSPRYTFYPPWPGSCKVNHGSPHTPKTHKTPRRVEFPPGHPPRFPELSGNSGQFAVPPRYCLPRGGRFHLVLGPQGRLKALPLLFP